MLEKDLGDILGQRRVKMSDGWKIFWLFVLVEGMFWIGYAAGWFKAMTERQNRYEKWLSRKFDFSNLINNRSAPVEMERGQKHKRSNRCIFDP